MRTKAVFHKDCVAKYNKSKLELNRKTNEKENETEQDEIGTIENLESNETQIKLARSSISLKHFKPTCLYCVKGDSDVKLHILQTFEV